MERKLMLKVHITYENAMGSINRFILRLTVTWKVGRMNIREDLLMRCVPENWRLFRIIISQKVKFWKNI